MGSWSMKRKGKIHQLKVNKKFLKQQEPEQRVKNNNNYYVSERKNSLRIGQDLSEGLHYL